MSPEKRLSVAQNIVCKVGHSHVNWWLELGVRRRSWDVQARKHDSFAIESLGLQLSTPIRQFKQIGKIKDQRETYRVDSLHRIV